MKAKSKAKKSASHAGRKTHKTRRAAAHRTEKVSAEQDTIPASSDNESV